MSPYILLVREHMIRDKRIQVVKGIALQFLKHKKEHI